MREGKIGEYISHENVPQPDNSNFAFIYRLVGDGKYYKKLSTGDYSLMFDGGDTSQFHKQGGNAYDEPFVVGTLDDNYVSVIQNGVEQVRVGDGRLLLISDDDAQVDINTAGTDVTVLSRFKSFILKTIDSIKSVFINIDNGRVGLGGTVTRATVHINGSIALPTFNQPQIILADTTIDMSTVEHVPVLSYAPSALVTLSLTPLTPDQNLSTGNAGRIFFVVNTGLGNIDFGGSVLASGKDGNTFTTLAPASSGLFLIMQSKIQQIL
jgi:hypothetical protein